LVNLFQSVRSSCGADAYLFRAETNAKQCKFNEMDKLDKSTTEDQIHLNRKKWIKLVMMLEKVK
jgi:hypothetical protein